MAIEELTQSFQWTSVQQQYFATIACNLISLSHGAIAGWVSPALPKLISNDTPLSSGPISNEQVSWVGSINCIGALMGSLTFGYFITSLGSKRALLFLTIPDILFWLLIYFGNSFYHILIAKFLGGWAATGAHGGAILFVSEIANDDIRGRLGTVPPFLRNIGTLSAFCLGASLTYDIIPMICICIPIVFALVFSMIPNTPRYYFSKGDDNRAERALKYYKGYKRSCKEEDVAFYKEFESLKSVSSVQKDDKKFRIEDFLNRSALKAIFCGCALIAFAQLTAATAIASYAVLIFQKVNPNTSIDAYQSTIILGLALICGSLASTYLADKFGRKTLNLVSLSGAACGHITTAVFYYLSISGYDLSAYSLVPVFSLSFIIFIAAIGIIPLAFVCSIEILPPKIRTNGMGIICCSFSTFAFISQKMFPILSARIDIHGVLLIYAVGCMIGFFFVLFIMKETSGQSLDDVGIEDEKEREANQTKMSSRC